MRLMTEFATDVFDFSHDEELWLEEFEFAYEKMLWRLVLAGCLEKTNLPTIFSFFSQGNATP